MCVYAGGVNWLSSVVPMSPLEPMITLLSLQLTRARALAHLRCSAATVPVSAMTLGRQELNQGHSALFHLGGYLPDSVLTAQQVEGQSL